jgi:two-component system response regulator AtoC
MVQIILDGKPMEPMFGTDLGADEPAFIFKSQAMHAVYRVATQVATSDAPILIYGESGTGKELFARLIHNLSNRREKPYIPVNCGVLKGELFADKFFGHEAGAFTGANRLQKGSFELAADGTLFLDEVGEIPQTNQVDFLRVLEERRFKRLGGEKDQPFQARIVAATNRQLDDMVREGGFRADLYYRLNVIPVSLPPLRERREEVPGLVEHFLAHFSHRYHKPDLGLDRDVLKALVNYSWPGNIRELKNLMERLVLLNPGPTISTDDLPLDMQLGAACPSDPDGPACLSLDAAVKEAEIRAIHRAFKQASGSKSRTADFLQISPRTLRHKLAQYGLRL